MVLPILLAAVAGSYLHSKRSSKSPNKKSNKLTEKALNRINSLEGEFIAALENKYSSSFSFFLEKAIHSANDREVRKDSLTFIHLGALSAWSENAKNGDLMFEMPSEETPIINPFKWEDFPAFLDEAFLPRLMSDPYELQWIFKLTKRYPHAQENEAELMGALLHTYISHIGTLETLVGKEIFDHYGGMPNTADPKYWAIKEEANRKWCLQESPEKIFEFFYGEQPMTAFDRVASLI